MSDTEKTEAPPPPPPPPAPAAPPAFVTPMEGGRVQEGVPTPGLSFAPGLRAVAGSKVPGTDVSHVFGPGQTPCDPHAAGLDLNYNPLTRAENRLITTADGSLVTPPPDDEAMASPGPNSAVSA